MLLPRAVLKVFVPSKRDHHAAPPHLIVSSASDLFLLCRMPASWCLLLILAATAIMALAQQYEGEPVAHTLPAPAGASIDRKSTRLNSSHSGESRMPSSA